MMTLAFLSSAPAQAAPKTSFMMYSHLYEDIALVTRVKDRPPALRFFNNGASAQLRGLRWRNWGGATARGKGVSVECRPTEAGSRCSRRSVVVELSRPTLLRCGSGAAVVGRFYSRFAYVAAGERTATSMVPVCPEPDILSLSLKPSGPGEWYAEASFCDRRRPARSSYSFTWALISSAGAVLETQQKSYRGQATCQDLSTFFVFTLTESYRVRLSVRNETTQRTATREAPSVR